MALRVGLVGYGVAGRIIHAPLLVRSGFEIAGVVTTNPERVAQAKKDLPEALLCSNLQQLLELDLDLVVVASRNNVHFEHAQAAIDAGVAVVVDKPVAPSFAEVEEIFSYAAKKSIPITVFYNRLWDADQCAIMEYRSLIEPIFRFESRYERWRPDLTAQSWRENLTEKEGGGVLIDLGSHLVAGALSLFGPATLTHARVQSIRGASNDDAQLILEHQSGVLSVLSMSAIAGSPGPRIRLLGRNGALVIENVDLQESALRSTGYDAPKSPVLLLRGDEQEALKPIAGNWPSFYELVQRALIANSEMPISADFALSVARILEDARGYVRG